MKTMRAGPMNLLMAAMLAAMVTMAVGCSGRSGDKWRRMMPATYTATGSVTYKGKPLEGATVVFHPRDGISESRRVAAGTTDTKGRFRLTTVKPGDGAVAGQFFVTVEKTTVVDPGAVAVPPDEFGAFPLGADPSTAKPLIPKKYFSPESSGLTAEVKSSGGNSFSFALQ